MPKKHKRRLKVILENVKHTVVSKFYPPIKLCSHYQQPVKVGSYTVLATAEWSITNDKDKNWRKPDLGIYLDHNWAHRGLDIISVGLDISLPQTRYPYLLFHWYDGEKLDTATFALAVDLALEHLANKELVEIGCLGGHGRTGTVIAAMIGKLENLLPRQAILETRARYCSKAVETNPQVGMVYEYLGLPYDEGLAANLGSEPYSYYQKWDGSWEEYTPQIQKQCYLCGQTNNVKWKSLDGEMLELCDTCWEGWNGKD